MRHSDPKLTANIYTDATHLPTFDAVEGLAWHDDQMANTSTDHHDAECPRLKKIFEKWAQLPEPIKVGIEALIESAIPR